MMPSLSGATQWLNSGPLSPAGLSGHVTLVDFWTLTCINWLRTEPYVRAWSQAYRADGLVVVGVHTPEFSFEHEIGLVRQATRDRSIDYPVAVDNDYAIWTAFDNHYWPALYFADADGVIRAHHFGEGRYEESERLIQRLLGADRGLVQPAGAGVEAEADWNHLRTPETYLGYGRGANFASPGGAALDERHSYEFPERLGLGEWALGGEWTVGRENVTLEQPHGRIGVRFHARDAHLVLSARALSARAPSARTPSARTPQAIPFRVLLDGGPPGGSHGADVDEDGNGLLTYGRLYQLVREQGAVRERVLEITVAEPGAEAYVFTFG
jgi:thiol-disulfide isomerase/thioredoxin